MTFFIKIKKWLKLNDPAPEIKALVPETKEFSYNQDFSYEPGKHIQQFVNKNWQNNGSLGRVESGSLCIKSR